MEIASLAGLLAPNDKCVDSVLLNKELRRAKLALGPYREPLALQMVKDIDVVLTRMRAQGHFPPSAEIFSF
jgi:hypothetical protein